MQTDELQRLVTMANQISRNSYVRGHSETVDFIESHLQRFWSRGMKSKLCAYASVDDNELDQCACEAALRLDQK